MKAFYPTINLLRGIAALMVCVFHFIGYNDYRGNLFPADSFIYKIGELGLNGVFIFFVISGFVIPLSLSKSNFNFKQLPVFLSKRFVRIEIPYIVSILSILFVGFVFALKNNLAYTVNGEQFLLHLVYLIPFSDFEWYNTIYWTLAIEFQFYIVITLLYCFLSSGNKAKIIVSLSIFGALNFILQSNNLISGYSTIFLQGILLFLIKTERLSLSIGIISLIFSAIATAHLHSVEISIFCFLTVLTIYFVEIDNKWFNRFGDISYSLYLTHGLIGSNLVYLTFTYATNTYEKIGIVLLAVLTSLGFAWFYWKIVEDPSKKMSKRIG